MIAFLKFHPFHFGALACCLLSALKPAANAAPLQFSGIYPNLATFNDEGECGTGAVVPWADRLWVISYGPHLPKGSTDKLYEITPELEQIVRPESIGGTPANRMIHRESNQLFIGPYAIDASRHVRTIPYTSMYGRLTATLRHLTDPVNKVCFATMEEGLYEVGVKDLNVTELWADEQLKAGRHADLPGYHGKGGYSGQGRIVYANNGDHAPQALSHPETPSGVLAEWDGKADQWTVVRRNQFTEVTGPGGIYGNEHPETDPIWSIGWDHRSLILMLLDHGKWSAYRLPKASHCYDGAHGWNTEWPRIRDIGGDDLLMTMHGCFWKFPRTFSAANSAGIAPRSTYLKVIGDFCNWQGRVVLGCDDTAKSQFLNVDKNAAAGTGAVGQSQSNLWFVDPAQLDQFGPPAGSGAVWLDDAVKAGEASDPYLFSGYRHRVLHLANDSADALKFTLEIDAKGDGNWTELRTTSVSANGYSNEVFPESDRGVWIRVKADRDCPKATALFYQWANDKRSNQPVETFRGIATLADTSALGGVIRTRGENKRTLHMAAVSSINGKLEDTGYYELDAAMKLNKVEDTAAFAFVRTNARIPEGVISMDAASVIFTGEGGQRFRLPKTDAAFDHEGPLGPERVVREICTERNLLNAHGTFYELPAQNAGGIAKVRPVASHRQRIQDYCTYRGMLILTGIQPSVDSPHMIHSDDQKAAVWAGAVDDLWQLGKPIGKGGPWKDTAVKAGQASDPYLLTGYDKKSLTLTHDSPTPIRVTIEIDLTGSGKWVTYQTITAASGQAVQQSFPDTFNAAWVRLKSSQDATISATFLYE